MKKMNIAFCLRDMQTGGVESVLIRTLDELRKCKDINISIITYVDIHEEVYKKYFESHPEIKLYSLYPSKWFGTKLPHFFLSRLFVHLLRDCYRNIKRTLFGMRKFKDIDVFIDYHDFGFVNELKHVHHAKKIAWFHSSVSIFIKRNFVSKLKFYDKVVLLTDAIMNDLKKMYPEQSNKFIRIYNMIDIQQIRKQSDVKNKIKGDYFCSVSRLSGDKDIKTLLNGFDLFWQSNKKPDVKLVIVGDGDKSDEYKNYAESLKSNKQIIFVGMQKNPFVYMKGAIANVLSSFGEGLPTVLIESAVVGTLNIASDCKYGPREILLDGDAGLLFTPGNEKQLSQCMSDVYNKKVNVKQMIKMSDNALVRFNKDVFLKNFISLIS